MHNTMSIVRETSRALIYCIRPPALEAALPFAGAGQLRFVYLRKLKAYEMAKRVNLRNCCLTNILRLTVLLPHMALFLGFYVFFPAGLE